MRSDYLKTLLIFFVIGFSIKSYSQGVWELQNPLPTSEDLKNIFNLPGTNTSWIAGRNGVILKSYDGNTWSRLYSGTAESLSSIWFADSNTGWTVSVDGGIFKTTNGGSKWTPQVSPTTAPLRTVQFLTKDLGWATGSDTYEDEAYFLKTINGGTTWTMTTVPGYNIWDVFFINSSTGWAAGWNGAILKTTDGGSTWNPQTIGSTENFFDIFFIDSNTGWVIGSKQSIYKTTNGGTSWTLQSGGTYGNLYSIHMENANSGWICGESGLLYSTLNGGTNWTVKNIPSVLSLDCIIFTDLNNGLSVGPGGTIIKTNNGGTDWISLSKGTVQYLSCLNFIDSNTGWVVGNNNGGSSGIILKTVDAGSNWITQLSDYIRGFNGVDFVDANTGWVVGAAGTILKTVDGGKNWVSQTSGTTENLNSVFFINSSTGWAVGNCRTVIKTTNGGNTWTVLRTQTGTLAPAFNGVYFVNSSTGWVVGDAIYKTTDGGTSWTSQMTYSTFNNVFFANANTGWITGGNKVLKTVDAGTNWTELTQNSTNSNGVCFSDINNGRVAYYNDIYRTSDGGSTWTLETNNTTTNSLKSLYFVNSNNGWAVGNRGTILHYTNYSPTTQARSLSSTGLTYQNVNLSWTRGNGNQCAVFIKQASSGNCIPDVNVTYLPNADFGQGDQVGNTGWYCVYNGSGTSANITGLQPNTSYRVQVCEYNYTPDFVHYNISTATSNPISLTSSIAPPQITSSPVNRTICETTSTTFAATASGTSLGYKWQVNQGAGYINITEGGFYSGSTTPTLSVTRAAASLNGYKYQCVVSNISGSVTSGEGILTVNALPVNPGIISGDTVTCLNNSYVYSVPPVSYAASYYWSLPSGFTGTSTTNTINIQTGQDALTGFISVRGVNACGSGPMGQLKARVKHVPDNASTISGLSTVCTGSVNTGYYTHTINGADYYIWSFPFGATGTSSTNSIMITFGTEPLSGQITVKGHNMCGDGVPGIIPVTVTTVPAAIGSISGVSSACRNQADVNYSVTSIPNATSYSWSLPNGITGSNSTNSVLLKFGPDASSGDLKVAGVNSCGTGGEIVFPVVVNEVPAQPGNITGPAIVCQGQTNVTYSVPSSERATSYRWELPDGTIETTLTNKIVLNFGATAASGNLSVTPLNSCGAGGNSNLPIQVSVPIKPVISISDNYVAGKCMSEKPVRLSVASIPTYEYQWYKNGIPVENGNSNYIENFLPQADYTVEADLNGCKVLSEIVSLQYAAGPDKPEIYAQGPTVWYLACNNISATAYKWYYNDRLIDGADKYFYLANNKLGKYQVSISNNKGCFTRSDIIIIPPGYTGTDDEEIVTGFSSYPNPTTGLLTIEIDNTISGKLLIEVINQQGKKVLFREYEKTSDHFREQLDLSENQAGMYVLIVNLNKFSVKRKIMIE